MHFFQLAFEAEIRFRDAVEAMEAKLSKIQEILDRGSLMDLKNLFDPRRPMLRFLLQ